MEQKPPSPEEVRAHIIKRIEALKAGAWQVMTGDQAFEYMARCQDFFKMYGAVIVAMLQADETVKRISPIIRFMRFVEVNEETKCWEWQGSRDPNGYGRFNADHERGPCLSHKWLYENLFGPVPECLDLDHLCRNKSCANPDHLEPVTRQVNILRGDGPRVQRERHAAKTHCKRGHPWIAENIYQNPNTKLKRCMVCKAMWTEQQKKESIDGASPEK